MHFLRQMNVMLDLICIGLFARSAWIESEKIQNEKAKLAGLNESSPFSVVLYIPMLMILKSHIFDAIANKNARYKRNKLEDIFNFNTSFPSASTFVFLLLFRPQIFSV